MPVVRQRQSSRSVSFHRKLASALGLFSLGLGAVELFAPQALERWFGISCRHRGLIRMFGAREIASGIGILSGKRTGEWLSTRVGGDAMDLATINSFRDDSTAPKNLAIAAAAVAGVTALDVWCAAEHCCDEELAEPLPPTSVRVNKTITVNCTTDEAYQFWHDFAGFPRFMKHLESVTMLDDRRSHWVAKGPAGFKVGWDAEITSDVSNALISWRTVEGSVVDHTGMVRFKPAAGLRGTVIYVNLEYRPIAGKFGATVARLFGEEPNQQVEEDLRRFKQFLETGEISTTQGQPCGSGRSWWPGR
jgi:uncharacterized membrane protein